MDDHRARDLVAGERVAVDGVHTPVAPDHFGQRHRDVTASCADIEAAPSRAQAQSIQCGDQRPAVDVVAQADELTHGDHPAQPVPSWLRTLRPVRVPPRQSVHYPLWPIASSL